MVWLCLGINFL
ncbi:hypothetical protein CFP56_010349 [Quercus suber]|uniref:Uncharacterized protein n=1 Tax=Quercus suber TaxID=58331 RepID=A0AAW0L1W5_QUESU